MSVLVWDAKFRLTVLFLAADEEDAGKLMRLQRSIWQRLLHCGYSKVIVDAHAIVLPVVMVERHTPLRLLPTLARICTKSVEKIPYLHTLL